MVAVATAVEGTRVARAVGTVWAAGGKSAWHAGRISAIDSKLSKREICRFLLVKVINRYALFSSPENPDLVEIFIKNKAADCLQQLLYNLDYSPCVWQ